MGEVNGLRKYFERRRWPRLSLGLVMILTGLAGFGISGALLHFGMREMWQRYPLAVITPPLYEQLVAQKLPMRVIARDTRRVVVTTP